MRYRAILALLSLFPACTTTTAIQGHDVAASLTRPAGGDLVLRGVDNTSVRLDPNSEICFHLVNGDQTRWLEGRELYHTEEGVAFAPDPDAPDDRVVVSYYAIDQAEVRNFSGAKTAAAVIGSVAVIVVVAALVSSMGKSSSSKKAGKVTGAKGGRRASSGRVSRGVRPRGKIGAGSGAGRSRVKVSAPRAARASSAHRVRPSVGPGRRAGGGGLRHAVAGRPRGHSSVHIYLPVDDGAPPPPPPPPSGAETAGVAEPPLAPGAGPEPPIGAITEPAEGDGARVAQRDDGERAVADSVYRSSVPSIERRLFSGRERRRSRVRLIGGVDAGTELHDPRGMVDGAHVGVRIDDKMELAGGFRHLLEEGDDGARESHFLGYGYLGYHFELDAHRWFAIPFGFEAGAGSMAETYVQLNLGLRIHPHQRLFLGLYPFNPTYIKARQDTEHPIATGWSFPSSVEVGFNF